MTYPHLQLSATSALYRANFPFVGQATQTVCCLFLGCGKAEYSMLSNTAVKILCEATTASQNRMSCPEPWGRPWASKRLGAARQIRHIDVMWKVVFEKTCLTPRCSAVLVLKEYSDGLCMHHRLKPSFRSLSGVMIRIKSSDQAAVCKTRPNIWPALCRRSCWVRHVVVTSFFSVQTARRVLLIVLEMSALPERVDVASVGVSVSAGQKMSVWWDLC